MKTGFSALCARTGFIQTVLIAHLLEVYFCLNCDSNNSDYRNNFGGGQIGQIWGPFMITRGLSCDRVEFSHFGGGSDDPPDTPLATGLKLKEAKVICLDHGV